jgi:hypothetical protein
MLTAEAPGKGEAMLVIERMDVGGAGWFYDWTGWAFLCACQLVFRSENLLP